MRGSPAKRLGGWLMAAWLAFAVSNPGHAATPACKRLLLEGQVSAGQEWSAPLGEGWVFRVVPVPPLSQGYSGWDLVVDRTPSAGFPDALYLATPSYNSINEREIATTYGLRAQDAIGWNPRSFRFFTDSAVFRNAQQIYGQALMKANDSHLQAQAEASDRIFKLAEGSAQGELRILDAHISEGIADAAPHAQAWARGSRRTRHELDPAASGNRAAAGSLNWMRFEAVLWLPADWKLPPQARAAEAACGQ